MTAEARPTLVSLQSAALESGLPVSTLRDLIARGALPVVRPPNMRRVWIRRADLEQAIERWREVAR